MLNLSKDELTQVPVPKLHYYKNSYWIKDSLCNIKIQDEEVWPWQNWWGEAKIIESRWIVFYISVHLTQWLICNLALELFPRWYLDIKIIIYSHSLILSSTLFQLLLQLLHIILSSTGMIPAFAFRKCSKTPNMKLFCWTLLKPTSNLKVIKQQLRKVNFF